MSNLINRDAADSHTRHKCKLFCARKLGENECAQLVENMQLWLCAVLFRQSYLDARMYTRDEKYLSDDVHLSKY